METNNNNFPNYENQMYNNNYSNYYNNDEELYSINRYNNNNRRYDRRYDRWDDNMYYNYPDCDKNGRCRNPMWWMFWPFFFF